MPPHHVPVVVPDIWMDGVTGLEVLARLCALSPRTRVIVITAREDLAARATAMAIGPVAFFMKPFDDEKFLRGARCTHRRTTFAMIIKLRKMPVRFWSVLTIWREHSH